MHINQVTDFDTSYNLGLIEIDEDYDKPEIQRKEVILTDETQFFFGGSNSNQIAQEIEKFIPEMLAEADELIHRVILTCDTEGKALLSVSDEIVSEKFGLTDFSFKERSFLFYLYLGESGCFILRLFSKF